MLIFWKVQTMSNFPPSFPDLQRMFLPITQAELSRKALRECNVLSLNECTHQPFIYLDPQWYLTLSSSLVHVHTLPPSFTNFDAVVFPQSCWPTNHQTKQTKELPVKVVLCDASLIIRTVTAKKSNVTFGFKLKKNSRQSCVCDDKRFFTIHERYVRQVNLHVNNVVTT